MLGLLAACLPNGQYEPGDTSTGSSSGGTDEPLSTGGVFTLTSATEGDASSHGTGTTDTSGTETASDTETATGTTTEGSSSTGAVDPCPDLVAQLTTVLAAEERCELLLRFDDGGALLGWHSECGPTPMLDTFNSKSALEATQCCKDGKLIGPGTSPFIYHQLPFAPVSGGVAVISNHLGAVLYDATIGVDAAGTILVPGEWQSPASLGVGAGCDAAFSLDATSHDLSVEGPLDPPPLAPAVLELLADSVAATALPTALGQVVIDRALALGYQAKFETPGSSYVLLLEISHK